MFFQPWSKILCLYVLAFKLNNLQASTTSEKKWKSHYYTEGLKLKTRGYINSKWDTTDTPFSLGLPLDSGWRDAVKVILLCLCTLQPSQYVEGTMAFFGYYCRFSFDQINRTRTDSVTFEGEDVMLGHANECSLPAHSSSEPYFCNDRATGISLCGWILGKNFYLKFWAVEGHLGYSVCMNSIKKRGSFCPELPILSSSLLSLDFYLAALYYFFHTVPGFDVCSAGIFFSFTHLIF